MGPPQYRARWRDTAGSGRSRLSDRPDSGHDPLQGPRGPASRRWHVLSVSAPRILVVGSANVACTVAVSRLPEPGETVSEGTLLVNHGGKGANQAVAARRLGAEVRFIGCVGADASGHAIRDALERDGIGMAGLTT